MSKPKQAPTLDIGSGSLGVSLTWAPHPQAGILKGFRAYYWCAETGEEHAQDVQGGNATECSIELPHAGHWFFALTAVDEDGVESVRSNVGHTFR